MHSRPHMDTTTTTLSRNFELQHSQSPLDTLVGRASLQREKLEIQIPQEQWSVREDPEGSEQQQGTMAGQQKWTTQIHNTPISPLLHGRFARDSFATNSSKDNNSYMAGSAHPSIECPNYDDNESVYSAAPSHTAPWESANMLYHSPLVRIRPDTESSTWASVPTVIVSSADTDVRSLHAHTGATPNFSPSGRPIIPPSDDVKRRVLERNMRRAPSHQSDGMMSQRPSSDSHPYSLSRGEGRSLIPSALRPSMRSPSPVTIPKALSVSPPDLQLLDPVMSGTTRSRPLNVTDQNMTQNAVSLPRAPSSRPMSPATSQYSDHFYYPAPVPERGPSAVIPSSSQQYLHPDPHIPATFNGSKSQQSQTPHAYLQLGIQCHEANKLQDSAIYFEKSAKENGGCGVGMLMWGLALRHGWGCPKDEKKGFNWLRRAAECAVDDLEKARVGMDSNLVQTELVLAIYEVGQCFFQGWGVLKDQKMAVSYYQVAARLGDADAQNDLAFCLANGKGCKKDRKEAAKWYRAAVAQGQSDIGLAWIYKEKYQ
ncbi:hypothetical protein JOM56_005807 [Amanita muscaria]